MQRAPLLHRREGAAASVWSLCGCRSAGRVAGRRCGGGTSRRSSHRSIRAAVLAGGAIAGEDALHDDAVPGAPAQARIENATDAARFCQHLDVRQARRRLATWTYSRPMPRTRVVRSPWRPAPSTFPGMATRGRPGRGVLVDPCGPVSPPPSSPRSSASSASAREQCPPFQVVVSTASATAASSGQKVRPRAPA